MKVTSVHRPEHAIVVALLRELRLKAGLTQTTVAQSLGVSQTAISDIEINERGVDFLLARDLCAIYDISMAAFIVELDKRLLEKNEHSAPRIKRKDKKRT